MFSLKQEAQMPHHCVRVDGYKTICQLGEQTLARNKEATFFGKVN